MFVSKRFSAILNGILMRICEEFIQTNQNPFNDYRCADGTIKPCASTKYGYAPAAMEAVSVFSIACFLIVIVLLLVVLLGSVVLVIRFGHLSNCFVHFPKKECFTEKMFAIVCVFHYFFLIAENAEYVSHSLMHVSTNALK